MQAEEREKFFTQLYMDAFPAVARYIARRGGTLDDARDIFQDAAVIYYEQAAGKGLQLTRSTEAYLFGIARHLWSRRQRSNGKLAEMQDGATDIIERKQTVDILKLVENTGKKCLELLHAFYYDRQGMAQIAAKFGFSGERSATVQKYKCLEKVRDLVKEKQLMYEDFAG